MEEAKKIKLFRLLATLLLLLPLGLCIFFLVHYITTDLNSYGLHVLTTGVLIFFLILQIILILKNMKKQMVIYDIAFNENKSVNKTALIFISVGAGLGLILTAVCTALYFVLGEAQQKTTLLLLLSIFFFMFINTGIFLLFTLVFRQREFKLEDLLK